MRTFFAGLVALVALAAVALLATGCGGGGDVDAPAATASAATPGAPNVLQFGGTALDGKPFDGTTLAGRPAVLWFWAPWCPKCLSEGPAFARTARKFGDRVAFVGVGGLDKNKDKLAEFVSRTGTAGVPQLDDRTGALYRHFKVTEQSSYVFINTDGGTNSALGPLSEAELTELVELHAL